MSDRPAVADWATDWDHLSDEYALRCPEILDDLRRRCPVAHTDRFNGAWLPTRYVDVAAVAHDTATFSSRATVVNEQKTYGLVAPPITLDPPIHTALRRALLPSFSPKATAQLEPSIRAVCHRLVDTILQRNDHNADAAIDYAQHIPVEAIAKLLGLPTSDADRFRRWIYELIEVGPVDVEAARRANREVFDYFEAQLEDRRLHPGDDFTSWVLETEVTDGHEVRPLTHKERLGTLFLMLVAGIDTTWSAIGSALWHLARNEDDRRRLVAEPTLIPTAVEEFLRAYSPVTMGRLITTDAEIGGCPVSAGERVLLSFPAANRDPAQFPDADHVVIDRADNRHVAFGLGIHRCLGSNLARLEMRVAIEVWLARIPEFSLGDPEAVEWSHGQVRGPRTVPVHIQRPKRG